MCQSDRIPSVCICLCFVGTWLVTQLGKWEPLPSLLYLFSSPQVSCVLGGGMDRGEFHGFLAGLSQCGWLVCFPDCQLCPLWLYIQGQGESPRQVSEPTGPTLSQTFTRTLFVFYLHDPHLSPWPAIFNYFYFKLEDNRFTMLCWFLPYNNMNQL